jgi:hypothetical protein
MYQPSKRGEPSDSLRTDEVMYSPISEQPPLAHSTSRPAFQPKNGLSRRSLCGRSAACWSVGVRDDLEVVAGYRYLDADYEDGSGADVFKYDMVTAGPGIGVSFKF